MVVQQRFHKILFSVTVSILLIILVWFGACAEQAPAPVPAPAPLPAPPLEEEWSADGVIKAGEYSGINSYGDYEIHWRSDGQYIYIGMKARTSGWVAVAIQPGSRMKDADMTFGFIKDGEAMVYDLFSTGDFGPHSPDTELGGTNNILESGGREDGEYTIIEFKRALDTADRYDNKLSGGKNQIIWAYGSADDLAMKHSRRGYGEIDL